jgi:hypothetical protein
VQFCQEHLDALVLVDFYDPVDRDASAVYASLIDDLDDDYRDATGLDLDPPPSEW